MAKKKRKSRSRQPNLPREVLDRAQARTAGRSVDTPKPRRATAPAKVTPPATPASRKLESVDLSQEYRYVVADLQRIGLLAVVAMLALVVLKVLAG
jgi:hypothetical protein